MKTVLTNGCFDILHEGHIDGFRQCRDMVGPEGVFIVALNDDASVRRLKGPERPINHQDARRQAILATGYVTDVKFFREEDDLVEIVKQLRPDFMVKDSEYKDKPITGRKELEEQGGTMVFQDRLAHRPSTTRAVEALKQSQKT